MNMLESELQQRATEQNRQSRSNSRSPSRYTAGSIKVYNQHQVPHGGGFGVYQNEQHVGLRHRSLLSETSELNSNTLGATSAGKNLRAATEYRNILNAGEDNERLMAMAKDQRRKGKGILGNDTANVL